jgi:hypothetical protein
MFAGKWTPWMIVGFISAPVLGFTQLAVISGIVSAVNPPAVEQTISE